MFFSILFLIVIITVLFIIPLSFIHCINPITFFDLLYQEIVTSFSEGKLKDIKSLLGKEVYDQFDQAVKDRKSKNLSSNTTFIGINSAEIKNHEQNKNMLEVTVEFVSEIISHIKDKENKTVSGDPEKIKKVHDIWKFSKDSRSVNPNWVLIDTQA